MFIGITTGPVATALAGDWAVAGDAQQTRERRETGARKDASLFMLGTLVPRSASFKFPDAVRP